MRLFAAILFNDTFGHALSDVQQALRARGMHANMTRPENMHLTLAFLGETDRLAPARRALGLCSGEPFTLTLTQVGRFGDLWWVGADGGEALQRLALRTQDAFRQAGFSVDRRPFRAHITLARNASFVDAPPRICVPDACMDVKKVSLMRSDRVPGRGMVYTELACVQLSPSEGTRGQG